MRSTSRRVDYDQIAPLYDEPGRDYDADSDLDAFLRERSHTALSSLRVLDTGCGTGKQLAADHARWPQLHLTGLDLFHGMLKQARKRCAPVDWVQGDSSCTPFAQASFDYITNQFSYHHVPDKSRVISEACRILKPGGRFVITSLDPWSMPDWILYRYFPASKTCDLADFLPEEKLSGTLRDAGFGPPSVRRRLMRTEEKLAEFLAYASARHRTSQLVAITDRDYADGLAAIRSDMRRSGDASSIRSEICLIWITADKRA